MLEGNIHKICARVRTALGNELSDIAKEIFQTSKLYSTKEVRSKAVQEEIQAILNLHFELNGTIWNWKNRQLNNHDEDSYSK